MKAKWALASVITLVLAGCGSDNDTPSQPAPPQPVPEPKNDRVFGSFEPHTMEGKYILFYWNEVGEFPSPMDVKPPTVRPIKITGNEIISWLNREHGGESVRNAHVKTFKPGNFSEFDVLVYATQFRKSELCQRWGKEDDCQLEFSYQWNPQRMAFDYSVNGDSNWVFSQDYYGGQETDYGYWGLEVAGWHRPSQVLSKHRQNIGFGPYSAEKMALFHQSQINEVTRLNDNDGKVIIERVSFTTGFVPGNAFEYGMTKQYISHYVDKQGNRGTMPVKHGAQWLTPVYSSDVTQAELDEAGNPKFHWGYETPDGFISCGITGKMCKPAKPSTHLYNVEVTPHNIRPDYYYDGVVTLADLVLSLNDHVDEQGNQRYSGTLIKWPTLDTRAEVDTYAVDSLNGLGTSGFFGWNYGWTNSEILNSELTADKALQATHIVGDLVQFTSPGIVNFTYSDMYEMFYEVQKFIKDDDNDPYRSTRHNVVAPKAPLTQSHFGWGVADCGNCHTNLDMHFPGNADLADAEKIQPALCAECHGNNGAKPGHGKVAGCYRCHFDMVGHGDAVKANVTKHPHEKFGSGQSLTMPDPYACVSCHYNDVDAVVGD